MSIKCYYTLNVVSNSIDADNRVSKIHLKIYELKVNMENVNAQSTSIMCMCMCML